MLPLFCLAAVVANQAVFRFGAMSPLWMFVLLLTIGALYWVAPDFTNPGKATARELPSVGECADRDSLPWHLCLRILSIGWNREFPFSGDTWFHVGQSYRMAFWWLSPVHSAAVPVPSLDDVRAFD